MCEEQRKLKKQSERRDSEAIRTPTENEMFKKGRKRLKNRSDKVIKEKSRNMLKNETENEELRDRITLLRAKRRNDITR